MGKKGIPMTVVMQGTAGIQKDENGVPLQGLVGSLYYEGGQATMTASAFNIKQAGGEM